MVYKENVNCKAISESSEQDCLFKSGPAGPPFPMAW